MEPYCRLPRKRCSGQLFAWCREPRSAHGLPEVTVFRDPKRPRVIPGIRGRPREERTLRPIGLPYQPICLNRRVGPTTLCERRLSGDRRAGDSKRDGDFGCHSKLGGVSQAIRQDRKRSIRLSPQGTWQFAHQRLLAYTHRINIGEAMTSLTIELPEEQKAALAAKARAKGLSAEQYARQVLEHDLVPEWLQKSWKTAKKAGLDQLSAEDIDAEIGAARKTRREARSKPGS
jgi:plasmid stability protein